MTPVFFRSVLNWVAARKIPVSQHAGPGTNERMETGREGERLAALYLKQHGMKILGRNVRVGRDELDLIARDDRTLVFIEVKTRRDELFGRPASAVDRSKQHRISRAAIRYLQKKKLYPPYIRFDIVEVVGAAPQEIRHLRNAFTLQGGYRIGW